MTTGNTIALTRWTFVGKVMSLLFIFFSFIFISQRLITLQYCSGFCHTLTWISHGFTCVPHPDPPSRLPPIPSLWVFPVHNNNNPICRTEEETQMYRTGFWILWEKVSVGWSERIALKHVCYQVWNRSPAQVECMSLLFNMLSRLVMIFLPRSKHLLISWLQSPAAVILEPPKI